MSTDGPDQEKQHIAAKKDSEELEHVLAPVNRRLLVFRLWRYGFWGVWIGSGVAAVMLLLGRFLPIVYVRELTAGLIGISLLSALAAACLRKIGPEQSAAVVDAFDQSNAMATALQYREEQSPVVLLQREEAMAAGRHFVSNLREHLPMPPRRNRWLIVLASLAVVAFLGWLPNPMDDVIAKGQQAKELFNEQQQKFEELKQQLEAQKLPALVEKPLKEQIAQLEERLKEAKSVDEALAAMERVMKEMQALANDLHKEQAKAEQMLREMERQQQLANIAKAMRQQNREQLKQSMDELQRETAKLDAQAKAALAKQLEQLAQMLPQDGQLDAEALRKAMEAAAVALNSSDAQQLQEKLGELGEQLAEALAKMSASEQSLAALQAQLAQLGELGQQLAQKATAAGLAVANGWSAGQGAADGLASAGGSAGDDAAWEDAAGRAQDGGAGQGAGQGAGAGSGAGSGAGAGGSGQGAGQGPGAGIGTGSRSLVMTPRKYEGEGDIYKDNGPTDGKGGEVQKGGTSPTIDGVSRPYEEVFNEYAAEAKESLNRAPLPERMQGLVEQYFLEIQPNP